jgi:hypothetical protein
MLLIASYHTLVLAVGLLIVLSTCSHALSDKSLFWHTICGRTAIGPKSGAVADCMRRTRTIHAIRKVKRDEDNIINERIADSHLYISTRDFWFDIKRIRSMKAGGSRTVDGQAEATGIAKLLILYATCVLACRMHDVNEMQCLRNDVNSLIANASSCADRIFNLRDVKSAVSHLKATMAAQV